MNRLELFEKIGREIEKVEEPIIYWDSIGGIDDDAKNDILEKGIRNWFIELCEYNTVHASEIERHIRLNVIEDYENEICEVLNISEDEFDPDDYLDDVEDYYPTVYIDPKDVFSGEYIQMRVTLFSDFDCQESHWLQSQEGYTYENSYFGDMVDALNLCPQKVKQTLVRHGIKVYGTWRAKKNRHGKEFVDYDKFVAEIVNNTCPSNLTFPVLVDLYDLWKISDYDETVIRKVIIPKNANLGLFSSFHGGGSTMELQLNREMTINLETSDWGIVPDSGYGISEVYGDIFTEIGIE